MRVWCGLQVHESIMSYLRIPATPSVAMNELLRNNFSPAMLRQSKLREFAANNVKDIIRFSLINYRNSTNVLKWSFCCILAMCIIAFSRFLIFALIPYIVPYVPLFLESVFGFFLLLFCIFWHCHVLCFQNKLMMFFYFLVDFTYDKGCTRTLACIWNCCSYLPYLAIN